MKYMGDEIYIQTMIKSANIEQVKNQINFDFMS